MGSAELTKAGRSWRRGAERRAELASTAAQQFYRVGFHRVSMANMATAVGLTAPAIYRHFRNKKDLLAAAIASELDAVQSELDRVDGAPLPDFVLAMAGVAIVHRDVWILLQRELRHLDPPQRQPIEDQFAEVVRPFRALVRRDRPDLPAEDAGLATTAVLATLASPSVYRARMPIRSQQRILAAAAQAACQARWDRAGRLRPAPVDRGDGAPPDRPVDRGGEILDGAIRLFAERGYQAVSLDEIGAEIGLAGPSLYHYYATKSDILVAAFTRASEWLTAQRRLARQAPSLDDLVAAYIDLGVRQRMVFAVYVREAINLPDEAGRRIRAGLESDVRAWCAALGELRPDLTANERLVLVHAARAIVHDVVRVGRWPDRPDITAALQALVIAVLNAPLERRPT